MHFLFQLFRLIIFLKLEYKSVKNTAYFDIEMRIDVILGQYVSSLIQV